MLSKGGLNILKKSKRPTKSIVELVPILEDWLTSSILGKELVEHEQEILDTETDCLFGYHYLQMSVAPNLQLYKKSTINHKFSLSPLEIHQDGQTTVSGLTDFTSLPLPDDSMDVVLLHHVLEFSQNPHQLLKEATRVVIPKGHIVIVGFNRWSAFGLWRLIGRRVGNIPHWASYSIGIGRMLDWLQLLDFNPTTISYGFYRPPFKNPKLLKRLAPLEKLGKKLGWPLGGFYCVVARKDVVPLTPIRPAWLRTKRIVVPLNIAKPAAKAN